MHKEINCLALLTFLLIWNTCIISQSALPQGTFAYTFQPSGKKESKSTIPRYKIEVAQQVFNRLIEAKGVRNMPRPKLTFSNAEQRAAWVQPHIALIGLEEKAYDICASMGQDSLNALAALLAHELIHYYEKHDWKDHFGYQNKHVDFSNSKFSDLELEYQADHLGGLLTHIAGFKALGVLPQLLTNIYDSYGLNTKVLDGYPSLEERRSLARKSELTITNHSRLFDMSIYLMATGNYKLSHKYLSYLLLETGFQSREIYNNLAGLQILQAISLRGENSLPYFFPIEMDINSRLTTRDNGNESTTQLLLDAEYNLQNAIILDKTYASAYLNLAILNILKRDWIDAEYFINKAETYKNKSNSPYAKESNINVTKGILKAMQGDNTGAQKYFLLSKSELGRLNICQLNPHSNCNNSKDQQNPPKRIIDNVDLNQLFSKIMQDKEQASLSVNIDERNGFHVIAKPNSEILIHLDHISLKDYHFYQIITNPNLQYKPGIKIGTNIQELQESLGKPSFIINSSNHELWSYNTIEAFFLIDSDDKIIKWCTYKTTMP